MGRGEVQGDIDLIQRQGGAVSVSYGYDNAARQTAPTVGEEVLFHATVGHGVGSGWGLLCITGMCMSLVHQLVATIKEGLFHALESQLADGWGGAGSPPRGHSSRSG